MCFVADDADNKTGQYGYNLIDFDRKINAFLKLGRKGAYTKIALIIATYGEEDSEIRLSSEEGSMVGLVPCTAFSQISSLRGCSMNIITETHEGGSD